MKIRLALIATLCLAAAGIPAGAHHLSPHQDVGYLAFWQGVSVDPARAILSDSPEYWKKAFVSKYSPVGFGLIPTSP